MTFVLGLKCKNGMVLCSDSLESDGVTKRYRQKIEQYVVGNEWGLAWAASGTGDVIDKFSDRVKVGLGSGGYKRHDVELCMEAALNLVNQDYPNDPIKVVATSFGSDQPDEYLYRGDSRIGCLSPENTYACAGMDVTLAQFILRSTYTRLINVLEGVRLGVFITSIMKEYADGVGADTWVVSFRRDDGGFYMWSPELISKIEKELPVEDAAWAISNYWAIKNKESIAEFVKHIREITQGLKPEIESD